MDWRFRPRPLLIYIITDRPQNEMRTTDKTSDKLLDDALDFNKVGNNDKNVKEIYLEWQKHTNEVLPALHNCSIRYYYSSK